MRKTNKHIYWTPRVLSILFILFLMMFSLDVIRPGLSLWQVSIGLFTHNIPALFLLFILMISWRYEIVGGIFFILAGLFYILSLARSSHFEWYMLSWSLIIAGPAFIIGTLFLINWKKRKKI
jgi:hypothetical protein